MNEHETEYDRLRNTPGTPEYAQHTEYLRAAGFTSEANARDRLQERERTEVARCKGSGIELVGDLSDMKVLPYPAPRYGSTTYEPPSQEVAAEHMRLLRQQIVQLQPSRAKDNAMSRLDECEFWLGKAPR